MKIKNFIAHIVPPHSPLCKEMNDNTVSSSGKADMGGGAFCLNKQNGFTLIEIIITIVIVAIFATMIYTYFGSSITQSGVPVIRMGKATQLQTVMENITADYKSPLFYDGTTHRLDALQLKIGTGAQNNTYGKYTVVYNNFITFTNYVEASASYNPSSTDNLLKVTVKGDTGEELTLLFSQL